jgi:hypothetical protein
MPESDRHEANAGKNPGVNYEQTGVDLGPILKFAVALVILGIVAFTLLWGLLGILQHQNASIETPPRVLARGEQERLPPEPRLQMAPGSTTALKTPGYETKQVEQQWSSDLNSYGWINKNAGVVRIPVGEAEKLLLQRGIPTLKGQSAAASAQH